MTLSRRPLMAGQGLKSRGSFNHKGGGCCLVTVTFVMAIMLGVGIISNYPVHKHSEGSEDASDKVVHAAQNGLLELERKAAEITGFGDTNRHSHWPFWGGASDEPGSVMETAVTEVPADEQSVRKAKPGGDAESARHGVAESAKHGVAESAKVGGADSAKQERGVVLLDNKDGKGEVDQSVAKGGSGTSKGRLRGNRVQPSFGGPRNRSAMAKARKATNSSATEEDLCACLAVYQPVCGADGKTYPSACNAACHKVKQTPGKCTEEKPTNTTTSTGSTNGGSHEEDLKPLTNVTIANATTTEPKRPLASLNSTLSLHNSLPLATNTTAFLKAFENATTLVLNTSRGNDTLPVTALDNLTTSANLTSNRNSTALALLPVIKDTFRQALNGTVLVVSPEACALVRTLQDCNCTRSVLGIIPRVNASKPVQECKEPNVEFIAVDRLSKFQWVSLDLILITDALEYLTSSQLNRTLPAFAAAAGGPVIVGIGGSEDPAAPLGISQSASWWLETFAQGGLVPPRMTGVDLGKSAKGYEGAVFHFVADRSWVKAKLVKAPEEDNEEEVVISTLERSEGSEAEERRMGS